VRRRRIRRVLAPAPNGEQSHDFLVTGAGDGDAAKAQSPGTSAVAVTGAAKSVSARLAAIPGGAATKPRRSTTMPTLASSTYPVSGKPALSHRFRPMTARVSLLSAETSGHTRSRSAAPLHRHLLHARMPRALSPACDGAQARAPAADFRCGIVTIVTRCAAWKTRHRPPMAAG
jgi:hypothetical protein